jgi:hypothetical protein
MTKIGLLLAELHGAETELAAAFRTVADRQAADHGTHYPCLTLARQCDAHAARLRSTAERHAKELTEPHHPLTTALGAVREKTSELLGRRPEPGLLLLRDLRQLYLAAEAVNVHWILLGQVAQAVRDPGLLEEVSALHKETLTQIKWLKTRLKEVAPQVLATAG